LSNELAHKNSYLVDSTGFVLKYWFSLPPVKTFKYESIAAFLGFTSFVIRLINKYEPKYISFAFDESLGTCFRNNIYIDYKKNRETAPEELKKQFGLCRKFLDLMGLHNSASTSYEADDILYTISKCCRDKGLSNIILTNDKDLYQLIYKDDLWWDYRDKKYSYRDLEENLGFQPQKMPDYLALMGDPVDNIPGAPGLGQKTASILMKTFGNLDKILSEVESIPDKLGGKYKRFVKIIKDNHKMIHLSKKLATLEYIEASRIEIENIQPRDIDVNGIEDFLNDMGMDKKQISSWLLNIKKLQYEKK
tara:strand:- start:377 stop:1294 length:918 start_codon:yes stop_codon:yes gene_type:complete